MKYFLTRLLFLMLVIMTPIVAQEVDLQPDTIVVGAIQTTAPGWTEFVAETTGATPSSSAGLLIRDISVRSLQGDDALMAQAIQNSDDTTPLRLIDVPLCFPNPARQATDIYLQYYLTRSGQLDVYIYDMMANLVVKHTYNSSMQGGLADKNIVKIQLASSRSLSVGVYFVFIMKDKEVLGKTKFAVIP